MTKKPNIKLVEVSERRQEFLRSWYVERAINLDLRNLESQKDEGDSGTPVVLDGMPQSSSRVASGNYDLAVRKGDVRLLRREATTDPYRFAYVAVLELHYAEGVALVAPFSPYSSPATKGEWLTGFAATPLRVLQLWNVQSMPIFMLAMSWRCCGLTAEEVSNACEVYRHHNAGTWPQGDLRESIGLAVHNPDDPRVEYQEEELELYAPIRGAVYELVARVEEPRCVARHVWFETPYFKQPLLAADDGSVQALTAVLDRYGNLIEALSSRCLVHYGQSDVDEPWQSIWCLEGWKQALPGLPVFAYASKEESVEGALPIAVGFTQGKGGDNILFEGYDSDVFDRLSRSELAFVVDSLL